MMVGLLRPSFQTSSVLLAARRGNNWTTQKVHNLYYKGGAKNRFKERQRNAKNKSRNPRDTGEEVLPFFQPQRYKLMYKVLADHKNCTRVGRKPMPDSLKLEFAQASKEYHAFKQIEREEIEKEINAQLREQNKAMDSILYLPDYLLEECLQDSGEKESQEMAEFFPSILYTEQILRLYPREMTERLKMTPAFEESFMKIIE